MGAVITLDARLETTTCWSCGIEFAMPEYFVTERREDKKPFYCPNGHSAVFTESTAQRLQKELDAAKARLVNERNAREWAEKQMRIARQQEKTAKTRERNLRKRVGAGVCPVCQRSFKQVRSHMAHKHPEFGGAPKEVK